MCRKIWSWVIGPRGGSNKALAVQAENWRICKETAEKYNQTIKPEQWRIKNKLLVVGTPEDLIKEIERVQKHVGGFGTFLFFANNFAPWEAAKRSYELAARYVFPYFQNTNSLREKSFTEAKIQHQELQSDYLNAVEIASVNYQNSKT